MDIAERLATYLDNANFGTVGTDIFVGEIPDGQNGLFVIATGGSMNNYLPIEESVLDIYCKDTSATRCVNLLNDIKRFIHRMHNTVLTDTYIYSILVLGDITDVDRDLETAKIYKITVQVSARDTSLLS